MMSEEFDRQLSELMDGEIEDRHLARCLRRFAEDRDYRARFSRYVAVRDCLRRDPPGVAAGDLADRVIAALEDEPVVLAPRRRRVLDGAVGRLLKPAAGLAIAASVAVVAVLGLRDARLGGENPAAPISAQQPTTLAGQPASSQQGRLSGLPPIQYPDATLQAPVAQTASATDRAWLNNYLLRHNEAAGAVGRTGFIPYVHIVTREPTDGAVPELERIEVQAGEQTQE